MDTETRRLRAEIEDLLAERVRLGSDVAALREFGFVDEAAEKSRRLATLDVRIEALRWKLREADARRVA